jgi:hypothetical protein
VILRSHSQKLGSGVVATGVLSLAAESQLTENSLQGPERNKSGRRIQRGCSIGTTNYLYDGMNSIEEIDQSGNVLAKYARTTNIDEPLSEFRAGTASYYEQDGLGSISSLTNSAGALANTYTYDSFGKVTSSTGTLTNQFQYTGREFESRDGSRVQPRQILRSQRR